MSIRLTVNSHYKHSYPMQAYIRYKHIRGRPAIQNRYIVVLELVLLLEYFYILITEALLSHVWKPLLN